MKMKSQELKPNNEIRKASIPDKLFAATQDYSLFLPKQLVNIIEAQKASLNKERAYTQEILSYVLWHRKLRANKYLTDDNKTKIAAYYDYMSEQKAREDGSRYYSVHVIAEMLGDNGNGNKKQAFSSVHSKMKQHGIIKTITEKQKNDKNKDNHYDIISPQFWTHPEELKLDEHNEWGGKRVAIHKDCGGLCEGRMIYYCTKCQMDHIEHKNITEISQEEYENREDLDRTLDQMDIEVDAILQYGNTNSDLPDTVVDLIGNIEDAMNATPLEIAQAYMYQEELLELADIYMKGTYAKEEVPESFESNRRKKGNAERARVRDNWSYP